MILYIPSSCSSLCFFWMINERNELQYMDTCGNLYTMVADNNALKLKNMVKINFGSSLKCNGGLVDEIFWEHNGTYLGKYILSFKYGSNYIRKIDYTQGTYTKYTIGELVKTKENESIVSLIDIDNKIVMLTQKHIYSFNDKFKLLDAIEVDSFLNRPGNDKATFFNIDPFWGTVVATSTHGVYFGYGKDSLFKKVSDIDLSHFNFVGGQGDSICYWWDGSVSTLAVLKNNILIEKHKYPGIFIVDRIVPYDKNSSLMVGQSRNYILDKNSLEIKDLFAGKDQFAINDKNKKLREVVRMGGFNAISIFPDRFYIISKSNGFYYLMFRGSHSLIREISPNRFTDIIYDSVRDFFLGI